MAGLDSQSNKSTKRRSAIGAVLGVIALVAVACQPAPPPGPPPTPLDNVPVTVSTNPADNTPWVMDGKVWDIVKVGNRVVVGGDFTTVQNAGGGTTYNLPYLFAFDPATGLVDPNFAPKLDGKVESLAAGPDGTSVIVGGDFKDWGTKIVGGLARLQLSNGGLFPGFNGFTNGWVFDVAVNGSHALPGRHLQHH